MGIIKNYWGVLRRLRPLHYFYNLVHYKQLQKNAELYKKYGIDKSVVGSISFEELKKYGESNDAPWLDSIDAKQKLKNSPEFQKFSPEIQNQIVSWCDNGYMIWNDFFDEKTIDAINNEVAKLTTSSEIDTDYTNKKFRDTHKYSSLIKQVISEKRIIDILTFVLGKNVIPFQTMNFIWGSEQKTHSDTIHMSTHPLGYLAAIWIALEDISFDCGPLHYYPGSQKLPYVMSQDFNHSNNKLIIDEEYYHNYEKKIKQVVKTNNLEKKVFTAKKGDVLVWHANLLHGGEERKNDKLSRKSLVVHYFCEGVICYHEITQRPAVIED